MGGGRNTKTHFASSVRTSVAFFSLCSVSEAME